MKKLLLLVGIISLLVSNGNAQKSESNTMVFNLVMPPTTVKLNSENISILESILLQTLNQYGISGNGGYSNFVIYPKVEIYEDAISNASMEPQNVIQGEVFLFIKQISDNKIFSSTSIQISGIAYNRNEALRKSITSIDRKNPKIEAFINEAKQKIINYYNQSCLEILADADNKAQLGNFEGAMTILMSIPKEANECYSKTREKAIEYYIKFENKKCAKQIVDAKAYSANKNYGTALEVLSQIDPATNCNAEAKEMIKQLEAKVDVEEKKQWELKLKQYADEVELEKLRINAIKDVTEAYYKSKPATINYSYIVK